jgi:hypothetical protein
LYLGFGILRHLEERTGGGWSTRPSIRQIRTLESEEDVGDGGEGR